MSILSFFRKAPKFPVSNLTIRISTTSRGDAYDLQVFSVAGAGNGWSAETKRTECTEEFLRLTGLTRKAALFDRGVRLQETLRAGNCHVTRVLTQKPALGFDIPSFA